MHVAWRIAACLRCLPAFLLLAVGGGGRGVPACLGRRRPRAPSSCTARPASLSHLSCRALLPCAPRPAVQVGWARSWEASQAPQQQRQQAQRAQRAAQRAPRWRSSAPSARRFCTSCIGQWAGCCPCILCSRLSRRTLPDAGRRPAALPPAQAASGARGQRQRQRPCSDTWQAQAGWRGGRSSRRGRGSSGAAGGNPLWRGACCWLWRGGWRARRRHDRHHALHEEQ